jgi:hypothetical protein
MINHQIKYKSGYKYQLAEEYKVEVSVVPETIIQTDYIELTTERLLTIKKGYAWDGPSGPTFDTLNFMRGSLVHDALYQLMRNGYIDREKWRKEADINLRRICVEDGMSRIRALWVYKAVRWFGYKSATGESKKIIYYAPKTKT